MVVLTSSLLACTATPVATPQAATTRSAAAPTATPTPEPSPETSPAGETIRPSATTPAISLPSELVGTWESDLSEFREITCLECGTQATLTLSEGATYTLVRGTTTVSGRLSIDGERLAFLGNQRCSGTGAYTWRVEGDALMLASVEPDGCPRRAEALDGITYTRAE